MMCFRRLAVEGDSLSVIKNIRKKKADKSVLRPITHHIHQLDMLFDEVTYNFVPRAVNDATHVLALEGPFGLESEGLGFMQFCFEFGEGSSNLQFVFKALLSPLASLRCRYCGELFWLIVGYEET
ncbi:hypothetical protein Gotri_026090, partial [Gossypium trilobum]|nr:hypothetical protein [Gossypium trilobum]